VRGDTATNVTKAATLETGTEIQVPGFVNVGDKVKIDTRSGQYLERIK
jgi:elongation factor P